ncbi:MAG: hypothetical protein J6W40_00445 [Alphaproteobacteria bacterium]|nr:hypothetical protein [Alphaproteobacteria bacterium]
MKKVIIAIFGLTLLTGCMTTSQSVLGTQNSQVETRNYQSRMFDTSDKKMVLRSVISTMQDLGFIIDRADETLGTVSGTSFKNDSKMTVSVRPVGKKQMMVRANASARLREISSPAAYQNFFNALSQSLFLDAHMVE